ncbi:hypothetical protein EDC65_4390 [Stella humosa]|uniref:Uncharacterized protein n=1 Tax=Stella humosa TaxID=94 RepID=A0A3N1KT30_9PROT|nr:hypothetical protein EDC65_4390 [Stella humosa]
MTAFEAIALFGMPLVLLAVGVGMYLFAWRQR